MKKLSILVIIVLIIGMLAVPVLAAQSATMSVSASKNTVYRGDTITITVSASKVDNCTSGGFMFSYDKNVFEYVSGSATLSGYTSGVSTAAGNVAGYFMNGNATVQGSIFQITLKVKDNAAFGNYTISGVPNMSAADGAVSCSAGSATITVACNHNYGGWSKVDDTNHGKTCSICQNVQKEAHKWDNGTTIKQATCKEGGQIKYTCTTCSAIKTVDTAKTTTHSYGSWTKVNDTTHKHTCSVCSKEETANHSWDGGKVTKQPTCKEEGVKTYTCSGCKATKTESVAKTTTHSYGSWSKVNDTTHKHTCSVCSKEETANHSWDSGKVTKQPTCKEEGVKTYTCSGCKATKTESIAKTTTHNYGSWTKVNDTTHKHTCSVCSKEETANHTWNSGTVTKKATCKEEGVKTYTCTACNATKTESIAKLTTHTYDHACDTDCNVCGVTRTTTHNYKTSWSSDKTNHWHECSVCKDKKDVAAHTPGAEATETKAQTCTTCGYVIKAALGNKNNYATTWTTDDAGHWYACSGCAEKGSYAAHDFENACDKDCSVCGFTRETEHKFAETWTTDANNHWHVCSGCGLKQDEAAHEPGVEATATTALTCTICGYEIAPALGEETTAPSEGTNETAPTTPVDQSDSNNEFPVWVVIVIAVVAIGGIAAFVVIKKKKS